MRPEEIGDLLGTDPESVIVAREGALEQLASELGMDDVSELDDVRARLAELPPEAWTGTSAAPVRDETAVVRVPAPEPRRQQRAEPASRKSRLPLLLALLAVAAIVLVVVLASSGDDEQTTASSPATTPKTTKTKTNKPPPAAPKPGPQVALTPLGGA